MLAYLGEDPPFPDESYKAAARVFPALVPTTKDDPATAANLAAWEYWTASTKPFITMFSDKDPITKGADAIFQSLIPGTKGQSHATIKDGGHFLQEDKGEEVAMEIKKFIERTQLFTVDFTVDFTAE